MPFNPFSISCGRVPPLLLECIYIDIRPLGLGGRGGGECGSLYAMVGQCYMHACKRRLLVKRCAMGCGGSLLILQPPNTVIHYILCASMILYQNSYLLCLHWKHGARIRTFLASNSNWTALALSHWVNRGSERPASELVTGNSIGPGCRQDSQII